MLRKGQQVKINKPNDPNHDRHATLTERVHTNDELARPWSVQFNNGPFWTGVYDEAWIDPVTPTPNKSATLPEQDTFGVVFKTVAVHGTEKGLALLARFYLDAYGTHPYVKLYLRELLAKNEKVEKQGVF